MIAKKKTINELRENELIHLKKALRLSGSGILKAEKVVEHARDKDRKGKLKYPSIESCFEWDDKKASYEYRLNQARTMLVNVTIIGTENKPFQAYVSLKRDRKIPGGGYRNTVNVLNDKDMAAEFLQQALDEFDYWEKKYHMIQELSPIFEVTKKVKCGLKRTLQKQ